MALRRIAALLFAAALVLLPTPASAAPSEPDGIFTDLGPTVTSLTIMEGTYAKDVNGNDAVYAVVAGDNARLNIVDIRTRALVKSMPLAGASGAWGITTASDGSVYVGTYNDGRLWRYEPQADRLTDLGAPIPAKDCSTVWFPARTAKCTAEPTRTLTCSRTHRLLG